MSPKTKRIFLAIIAVLFFYCFLFFLPKVSYEWGSAIDTTMDCKCFGTTKPLGGILAPTSITYCYGIPYNCVEYNLLYRVPFLWFAAYSLIIVSVLATLFVKEKLDRKRFVLIVLAGLGLWSVLKVLLASFTMLTGEELRYDASVPGYFIYLIVRPFFETFGMLIFGF